MKIEILNVSFMDSPIQVFMKVTEDRVRASDDEFHYVVCDHGIRPARNNKNVKWRHIDKLQKLYAETVENLDGFKTKVEL